MVDGAPLVTVVIAAWNAERTLTRAVESALAQTVPVEVIVVDDASTDGTAALAERLAAGAPALHVLRQAANGGPSAARNRAIAESRAPWIAVLDADDHMAPDRLSTLMEIAGREGADFVADDLWKQAEGVPDDQRRRMLSDDRLGILALDAESFVRGNLSSHQGGRRELGFLKPLMSRAFLARHGLDYDPAIRLGEDFVLYTQTLIAGARWVLTDPAGYVAMVRPGSLSGQHPTEAHAHLIGADLAMLTRPDLPGGVRTALRAHLLEQRKKWAWRRMIDAVRTSDLRAAAGCFWGPPQVGADLLARLGREAVGRLGTR
ncbi:MAG: glycosyltransferase family 2 protein [Pseudomonadota bacterium]